MTKSYIPSAVAVTIAVAVVAVGAFLIHSTGQPATMAAAPLGLISRPAADAWDGLDSVAVLVALVTVMVRPRP